MPVTPDLASTLDKMHAAILQGDFNRLSQLVPDLDEARRLAESAGHPNPSAIRERAERNALCLQAAIHGVKSARRRIADVANAARGLTTYDKVGGKATLASVPPKSRRV